MSSHPRSYSLSVHQQGYMLMIVLVFMAIFIMVTGSVLGFSSSYHRLAVKKSAHEQALHIAEAGIHYYRWHLAHSPDDFTNDTGVHDYRDPQGGVIGQFDIQIVPPVDGSRIVTLQSTGWTTLYPNTKRVIEARYGRPTLADYGFLTDSNVWFGEGEELVGPTHSNGGIRMDGESDSRMTSEQEIYLCGPEHGCSNQEKPGIWGTGEIQELWDFPTVHIDFETLSVDLENIEELAATGGVSLGDSEAFGYHINFHNDNTFTVTKVTALRAPVWGYNGVQWVNESHDIATETAVAGYTNHAWPANNVIFVADDLWIDGQVNDRVVVAAARLPAGEQPSADVYIQNDLVMPDKDGSAVIGVIGQEDVLVPMYSENVLEIDAVLMAQEGHVFRYYYPAWNSYPYNTYSLRDRIEIYGGIITKTLWTWSWVSCDTCSVISGYRKTETTYNPYLTFAPPPFWPTQDEYIFISWEERFP